ncbi:hypothetical protein [Pseudonocardia alni]|uniref:hypothetical protein n=1 Tax=Pseudonocardia alni TaxID=33907 RepID=UPI00247A260B|nr:hypothetical protein [Pseudonocardia alni]WFG47326.1 hypothetical protein PaSha_28140 [Pseudonocardia alni]
MASQISDDHNDKLCPPAPAVAASTAVAGFGESGRCSALPVIVLGSTQDTWSASSNPARSTQTPASHTFCMTASKPD